MLRKTLLFAFAAVATLQAGSLDWPKETQTSRPWSYWWWMGSAVDALNLTRELETYRNAGWGGLHIIPIYGARGYEKRYIDYLSPKWMDMLRHTVAEGKRLDMGIDMTLGSGWCFGGPDIPEHLASATARFVDNTVVLKPNIKVKRAAPGGEGWMLNPFSQQAIDAYLPRFTKAFADYKGDKPRAVYHDSFEYGANWSPDFEQQFERLRGYPLKPELPVLFGNATDDRTARVKADYRETLSDLVYGTFTKTWTSWAKSQGFSSRNQAHGSPANLLDVYAAADIPETEMFNADRSSLISKFASSASHVAGHNLTSAETGTWLKEHFHENLSDLKDLIDQLWLAGVNHVIYHGSAYSPSDAPWPGWSFYASTEMNWRNTIFPHVIALNTYIARAQSMLQEGDPDNDVLIYWPVHDVWHNPAGLAINFTVHKREWVEGTRFGKLADQLTEQGWSVDFVSDRQLAAPLPARYKAIVVPPIDHMPVETMQQLLKLSKSGRRVIFDGQLPQDVPGLHNLEQRRAALKKLAAQAKPLVAANLEQALSKTGARQEKLPAGLQYIRRTGAYFIANRGTAPFEGWVPLNSKFASAVLLDPMTGTTGVAATRAASVYLQLERGASIFVRPVAAKPDGAAWPYLRVTSKQFPVEGIWNIIFTEGRPEKPYPHQLRKLESISHYYPEYSGRIKYAMEFIAPEEPGDYVIDLGAVSQSAKVRLNQEEMGYAIMPPFRVPAKSLKPGKNWLEVEVTTTAANAIRELDLRKTPWKVFHDINIVGVDYKPLDASKWPVEDTGLLGPVTLRALEKGVH